MIYFIGIKGTGMSALACILHDLGIEVMGSDLEKHFFTEEALLKRNIKILPFDAHQIPDHSTVIIGNAFLEDFPEVKEARSNKTVKCCRYHEFLGELMKKYTSFAVAGSHGKTTTTTLLSDMMKMFAPTGYLIGDGTGHIDRDAENIVVEACEYRRHFLAYHPDYAVITNVEIDHVDYYKSEEDYSLAYEQFAAQVKKMVFLCGDDEKCRALKIDTPHLFYGVKEENDVRAIHVLEEGSGMSFDVLYKNENIGHFSLPFVGHHLLLNSLAVIAVGLIQGLNAQQIEQGLMNYSGAKRRFVVEEFKDNVFIDDYAHHPTEVKVTIEAARIKYPDRKLIAVFKPHRVSRVYYFAKEFAEALSLADEVFLCDFTSIDDKEEGIDIDISYLQNMILGSRILEENEEGAKELAEEAPAVYLFMSSKDIYGLSALVKRYQK